VLLILVDAIKPSTDGQHLLATFVANSCWQQMLPTNVGRLYWALVDILSVSCCAMWSIAVIWRRLLSTDRLLCFLLRYFWLTVSNNVYLRVRNHSARKSDDLFNRQW